MSQIDYTDIGNGHKVVLLHASASDNRQWLSLMSDYSKQFRFIALNLIGYGNTTPWTLKREQRLIDHVYLLKNLSVIGNEKFSIVGHSFGGSIAMKVAQYFSHQVENLILLEPNPFYLLKQHGQNESFKDVLRLRGKLKHEGKENWQEAVKYFSDYWNGKGHWEKLSIKQKEKFSLMLKPNIHEWDSVMNETTTLDEWRKKLPAKTTLITASDTVKTIQEITDLFKENIPNWSFEELNKGGHLAPITRPNIVNELIIKSLL